MSSQQIYQLVSVLLLTGLLFFPVSKIVWVLSVRRLQRKREEPLSEPDIARQLRRARLVGFLIALVFSYLFHINVLNIV